MSGPVLSGFAFKQESGWGRLNGSGLGAEPGSVRMTVYAEERKRGLVGFGELVRRWRGPSVEMRPPDVTQWRDDLIEFVVPGSHLGEMDGFMATTGEQFKLVNPHGELVNIYEFTCEVTTAAGEVLTFPEMRKRKPDPLPDL